MARHATEVWQPDRECCERHKLDFLRVAYPGFSWHNLQGEQLDAIPRQQGEFLWSQVLNARQANCEMLYVAMFDEVDEGTAIFNAQTSLRRATVYSS